MSLKDVLDSIVNRSRLEKEKQRIKTRMPSSSISAATSLAGLPPGLASAVDVNTPTVSTPSAPAPAVKKPYNIIDEIAHSAMKIPGQVLSQGLDMASFVTSSPTLAEASRQTMSRIEQEYPSTAPQLTSVEAWKNAGPVDVLKYGLSQAGQVPASMLSMAVPGMAINKVVGPVMALAKNAPAIGKFIDFLGGAEKAAELASLWGGSSLLEAGSISTDVQGQTGQMPGLSILPSAIFAGALEAVPTGILLGRLKKAAPEIALKAAKLTGRPLVKFIADAATSMGAEGGTEFLQTLIEESGAKVGMGQSYEEAYGSTIKDPEAIARGLGAAVSGAFGGGSSSAVTSVIENLQKRKQSEAAPADPTVTFKQPKIKPSPTIKPDVKDESFQDADVGGNVSVADSELKAFRDSVIDTFSNIGVQSEEEINTVLAGSFPGKTINDLSMDELESVRDFIFDRISEGDMVQSDAVNLAGQFDYDIGQKAQPSPMAPSNVFEAVNAASMKPVDRNIPLSAANKIPLSADRNIPLSGAPKIEPTQMSLKDKIEQIQSSMPKMQRADIRQPEMQLGQMTPTTRDGAQINPQERPQIDNIKIPEMKPVDKPAISDTKFYVEPFPEGGFVVKDKDGKQISWNMKEEAANDKANRLNNELIASEKEISDAVAAGETIATDKDMEHLFGMQEGDLDKERKSKELARKDYDDKIKTEAGLNEISEKDHQFINFNTGFGKNKGKEYATEQYIATDKEGAERTFTLKITRDEATKKIINKEVIKGRKTTKQEKADKLTALETVPADLRKFLDDIIPEDRKDKYFSKKAVADQILNKKFRSGLEISNLFGRALDDDAFVRKNFGNKVADDIKNNGKYSLVDMLDALIENYEATKEVTPEIEKSNYYVVLEKGLYTIKDEKGKKHGSYSERSIATEMADRMNDPNTGWDKTDKDGANQAQQKPNYYVGQAGDVNVTNLTKALVPEMEKLLTADKPMDNRQLKKIIKSLGIDTADNKYNHKITQEAVEAAMVEVVRKNNLQGNPDALIKLYKNQPNLSVRTGTSIANQAYSTPIPIVGMVTNSIGDIAKGSVIYEPTAGNGLLLTGIKENESGTEMNYHLNELDKTRNDILKDMFPEATITNKDAFEFSPGEKADVVFTNPPFGSLKSFSRDPLKIKPDGEISPTITFRKADHAIVYKALQSMKDDGRAVIVVGADLIKGEPDKSVIKGGSKPLYNYLYNQFNITGHFEISGKLYNRQGANWPVSIITLEGKKPFPRNYVNAPDGVERAVNWDEVKKLTSAIKPGNYITGQSRTTSAKGQDVDTGADKAGSQPVVSEVDQERIVSETRPDATTGDAVADVGRAATGQPIPDSTSDNGKARDADSNEFKPIPEETYKDRSEAIATSRPVVGRLNPDDNSGVVGEESELQAEYKPVSKIDSIGSLVPVNLENPIKESLEGLKKEVGKNLEDYVSQKLGYKSSKDLIDKKSGRSILSAEQIDAVSLAVNAIDSNAGVIVADQTGLGKGRVAAASIAYAVKAGKTPVFLTEKAGLFNDIYRDLKKIREGGLRPFIFNSDGAMSDPDTGEKIYSHKPSEFKDTFNKMQKGDFSDFGKDGKYDFIVSTYSQFNNKTSPKLNALLKAPEKSLVAVLDESHNAAGVSEGKQSNQGKNVSALLAEDKTSGVVYLSATWAKRPEQMIVYHRAFGKGKSTIDEINEAFTRGGLAMQEMMVTSMARQRSYIRREQSFKGVKFQRDKTSDNTPASTREKDMAEKTMDIVMNITNLGKEANALMVDMDIENLDVPDDFVGGDFDKKGNPVTASVDVPTSPFSQVHNYVSAFVTSLKAKDTATKVVNAIKSGQKPVIVVKNTMESQLNSLIDLDKAKVGSGFSGTFSDVLDLIQDKILTIPVKSNFDSNKKMMVKIPLSEFPVKFQDKFKALKDKIKNTSLADMPFSPIDYLKSEISKAGFNPGELTGRSKYLDYSNLKNGEPTLSVRNTKEYNQEGRRKVVFDFNNGGVDALILNQAGSTGLSAHSSFEYKDQRQRVMYILQAFDDINTFMQMIGRVHRVGAITNANNVTSVVPGKPAAYGHPEYKYLQSSLGMEIRTGIQLENKMKSLNAQTSSNEKGHQSVSDVDVMNKYGLEAMENWLNAHPQVEDALELDDNLTVERITGRMALASQQLQNEFWTDVVSEYNETIAKLDAAGENDLVVPTMEDANAKTLSKKLVYGEENNMELPPVYIERVELTLTGKPVSLEGARQRVDKGQRITEDQLTERNKQFDDFLIESKKQISDERNIHYEKVDLLKTKVENKIKTLKPGNLVLSNDGQMGVITNISFKPTPTGYISNPFNPSLVNIEMASNNKTGKIVVSLAGFVRDGFSTQGNISNVPYSFENVYEKEYNSNLTRKVTTDVLTGDMIKAQSMNQDTVAVQFGREDGTQDFGWMDKNYRKDTKGSLELVMPVEVLTNKEIKANTPEKATSIDGNSVEIRPATNRERDWYTNKYEDVEIPGDPKTKPFEIIVLSSKSSKFGRAIYSNKKLLDLISEGDQDAIFTETKKGNKKALKTGKIDISKKAEAMQIVNNILKGAASGLVDANRQKINADKITGITSSRSGAAYNPAQLVADMTGLTRSGLYEYLESAYDFIRRGSGSLARWIERIPDRIRTETSRIWNAAKRFHKAAMRLGRKLGRRGGHIRLSELSKMLKQELKDIAKEEGKPLPSMKTKKAVGEGLKQADKIGKAEQRKVADKTLKRTREQAKVRESKLKDKIKDVRSEIQAKKTIEREQKKLLLGLVKRLPIKYQARLSGQIARADTVQKAADVINKIDDLLTNVNLRKARSRMQSAIKDAVKLHPDFQKIADNLKEGIEDSEDIYDALDSVMNYVENNDVAFIDERLKLQAENLLEDKPDIITKEAMEIIGDIFEQVKFQSDAFNKKAFGQKAQSIKDYSESIKKHLPNEKTAVLKDNGKRGGFDYWFNIGLMDYDAISSMLGKAGHELFYDNVREGEAKFKETLFEGKDNLIDVLENNNLEYGQKTVKWLDQETKVTTSSGDISLTRGEKMNLVANLLDKSTFDVIVGIPGRPKKRGKGMTKSIPGVGIKIGEKTYKLTDEQAKLAISSLGEKEASVIKALRDFLNGKLKEESNKVWTSIAGYEKALSSDYWPRMREHTYTGLNEGFKQWAASALENLGMWKQRTRSSKPVVINDVMTTYENHINKASNFIGYAEALRNIEMAFGVGGIAEALEKKFGKQFLQRIKDQLNAISMGVKVGTELEGIYSRALRRIAGGKISGNLRVAARQYGGLFTATTELGSYVGASMGDLASQKIDDEMMENSPIIRDRYESAAERIVSPLFETGETWLGRGRGLVDEANKLLSIPFQKADRSVSRIIWSAAKKEVMAKNPDLKGKELLKKVARRTEQVISRTQNVTSVLDYSGIAIDSKKNQLLKTITTFQSQGNSIYNVLRRTFRDFSKGDIGIDKVFKNIFMANVANTIFSLGVGALTFRGLGGDDDEDGLIGLIKNRAKMAWDYISIYNVIEKNLGMVYGSNVVKPFLRKLKRILETRKYAGGRVNIENLSQSDLNDLFNSAINVTNSFVAKKRTTQERLLNKGLVGLFQGAVGIAGGPVAITRESLNIYNLLDK